MRWLGGNLNKYIWMDTVLNMVEFGIGYEIDIAYLALSHLVYTCMAATY